MIHQPGQGFNSPARRFGDGASVSSAAAFGLALSYPKHRDKPSDGVSRFELVSPRGTCHGPARESQRRRNSEGERDAGHELA